ncbi:hypothetical protein [Streptomyces sp. NPDC002328]|uniref:hypothetical protein n=1 Tax=Streptomyces sp. NPDC002328 TaxID=3364642 RepID=UPI0036C2C5B0
MSVDLTGFLAVVLLAYLVPGPDFLVIVRAAARSWAGRRPWERRPACARTCAPRRWACR